MSKNPTYVAPLVEWYVEKGFGYLEHEGQRLFLHAQDFSVLNRRVKVGDEIMFTVGTDDEGRKCAKNARHAGSGLKIIHLFILAALLVAPGLAIGRLGTVFDIRIILGCVAFILGLTYLMYWDDKRRARAAGWRVPENTMHFVELIGGWPAAFLAQCQMRHKRTKFSYQLTFWLIVALYQFVTIDYILGWPMLRDAGHSVSRLLEKT
jgi:uncharacterized membrane protein YsdA (DUF1294 family)/cold shock CspA family protein